MAYFLYRRRRRQDDSTLEVDEQATSDDHQTTESTECHQHEIPALEGSG
jgi:hypothetical protein